MQRFFLFVFMLVLLSACGTFRIEKRQYRGGWYLERLHKTAQTQLPNEPFIDHTENKIQSNDLLVSKTPTTLYKPLQEPKQVVKPSRKLFSTLVPSTPNKKAKPIASHLFSSRKVQRVDDEPSQEQKRLWFNLILLGALLVLIAAVFIWVSWGSIIATLILGSMGLFALIADLIYRPKRIEKKEEVVQPQEPEKSKPIDPRYGDRKEKRYRSSDEIFASFLLSLVIGSLIGIAVLFVILFFGL